MKDDTDIIEEIEKLKKIVDKHESLFKLVALSMNIAVFGEISEEKNDDSEEPPSIHETHP